MDDRKLETEAAPDATPLTVEEVRAARERWQRDLAANLAVKRQEIRECDERGRLLRRQRDEIAEELRAMTPRKRRKEAADGS